MQFLPYDGFKHVLLVICEQLPYLISCAPAINHGFSGLHYAAKNGYSSVLRFLVMNGADVNLRTSGYTPLHLAAIGKQHEIIAILLRDCGECFTGY
uniref:ANK_REP_REGION domain-containing protein n=1 Tax=Loa loa TaxID=7209 RepID=A0A1I7VH74_LOALO